MVSDLLRHFQLAAVLQIRRNAGRAESMITNPRFDAGRFRAPADDAVGVLLEEGIGGKLAGLAAGAAEEIAVDVIGDGGRFDPIYLCFLGRHTCRWHGKDAKDWHGDGGYRTPNGR